MGGRGIELGFGLIVAIVFFGAVQITGSLLKAFTIMAVIVWLLIVVAGIWLLLFTGARPRFMRRDEDKGRDS